MTGVLLDAVQRNENSLESSRRRTKRLTRWQCKNIGADHLITFTTRELSNTPGDLWVKWQRLVKGYHSRGRVACRGLCAYTDVHKLRE